MSKLKEDEFALFKSRNQTDLSMDMFTTISGVKGTQFGKDVYSTVLKFKDLEKFLDVFPSVQRNLTKSRIYSIKKYIMSGLDKEDKNMRFFSAVTVTCRGTVYYDNSKQRIAIDTRSKMSINDGQHRYESIKQAIQELSDLVLKNSKDKELRYFYEEKLEELKEMIIPVIIFDGLDEREEQQLFHDLNNLQKRPSMSANLRLSQTDLFAVMCRDLADYNKYLKHYGVEMDKTSIHKNNSNTILLATLHAVVKELLGTTYWAKNNNDILTNENYNEKKELLNIELDKLFFALPNDINVKGKYVIEKSYGIKGLVKFINHARNDLGLDDDLIYKSIGSVNFENNPDEWIVYGGVSGKEGNVVFGGTSAGINAVFNKLLYHCEEVQRKELVKSNVATSAHGA